MDLRCRKNLWKHALHHRAIFQHVRDPGWTAQVIFQDVNLTVAMAHQIRPSDMAPNAPGWIEPDALFPVCLGRKHDLCGKHAVFQDLLVVIKIVNEKIQSLDPLLEAPLDADPLSGWHDAGYHVERKYLLHA